MFIIAYNNYIDRIVLPAGKIPDGKVQESLFMKENNTSEEYTYIRSKEVPDFDGWNTEYTMYYDEIMERYVFVLGDSDLYDPNDGYKNFDFECETEREANEWFDNYVGFEEELDECQDKVPGGRYWEPGNDEETPEIENDENAYGGLEIPFE